MVESMFAMAKLSVEVMVLLFGTLTLWLGFLRIAEKAGHRRLAGRTARPAVPPPDAGSARRAIRPSA